MRTVISVLLHAPRVQLRLQDQGIWTLLPLGSCYSHPALPGVQRALHTARPKTDWVPAHQAKISAFCAIKKKIKQAYQTFLGILNNCLSFFGGILLPTLEMKDHASRVALSSLSLLGYIWKRLALHLFDIQVNSFPSSQARLPVWAFWKAGLEINLQTLGRGSRKKTHNRFEKRLL